MTTPTSRLAAFAAFVTAGAIALSGCSLISMVPGVPHVTTDGTVAFTYDGKPVKVNIPQVICAFDGKGNVAFLSGDEKTGDTFVGAYSVDGDHVNTLKTAEYPLSLTATNSSDEKDISKATVNGNTYTFEGVTLDLSSVMSGSGKQEKKPYKAVVVCK